MTRGQAKSCLLVLSFACCSFLSRLFFSRLFLDCSAFFSPNASSYASNITSHLVAIWALRGATMIAIVLGIMFMRTPFYRFLWQPATTGLLVLICCLGVAGQIVSNSLIDAYGVSVILLLTCISTMFYVLRFAHIVTVSSLTILFYIIGSVVGGFGFPFVCGFLILANALYISAGYICEFYSRQDFIRLRKRKYEEKRSALLLKSMLPEVRLCRHLFTFISSPVTFLSAVFVSCMLVCSG